MFSPHGRFPLHVFMCLDELPRHRKSTLSCLCSRQFSISCLHVPPCLDNKRRATGSIASCGAFEFVKDMVFSVGSLVSRKTSTPSMVIVIEFMFFHGDCYGSVS